jgi:hypothetical protein
MAMTLQQRINVKRAVDLTTAVTFIEKAKEAINKVAQDICKGDITITDSLINGPANGFTANHMIIFALKCLSGSMDNMLLPMVLDDAAIPAIPDNASDANFNNAVKRSIVSYCKMIASGLI